MAVTVWQLGILIGAGSPGCESLLGGVGGEKDSYASETRGTVLCGFAREHGATQFDPIRTWPTWNSQSICL